MPSAPTMGASVIHIPVAGARVRRNGFGPGHITTIIDGGKDKNG
jgi:hypothetical protein